MKTTILTEMKQYTRSTMMIYMYRANEALFDEIQTVWSIDGANSTSLPLDVPERSRKRHDGSQGPTWVELPASFE